MVTVALGVGDADQRTQRQILLHAETGLTGQVFASDKMLLTLALHLAARVALTIDL